MLDRQCGKHYINEEELEEKLMSFIEKLNISKIKISQSLKASFEEYRRIASQVLSQQNISIDDASIDIKNYARYLFKKGSSSEKREFAKGLGIPLYLCDKKILLEPFKAN